jgi:hypothetical protein
MTQPFADGANAQGNLTSLMKNTAFVDTVKNLFQFKHSGISTDHTNSYVQQAIRFLLGTSNTKPVYPSGFADSAKGEWKLRNNIDTTKIAAVVNSLNYSMVQSGMTSTEIQTINDAINKVGGRDNTLIADSAIYQVKKETISDGKRKIQNVSI